MPVVWSASPALGGRAWRRLAVDLFLAVLLWLETTMERDCAAGISVINKAQVCDGSLGSYGRLLHRHGADREEKKVVAVKNFRSSRGRSQIGKLPVRFLLLAGRGGGGEGCWRVLVGCCLCEGCTVVLPSELLVSFGSAHCCDQGLRKAGSGGVWASGQAFERRSPALLLLRSVALIRFLLAGRGGEGEGRIKVMLFEADDGMCSLYFGEVIFSEYCLCCIWIKNEFEDVLQMSVKAFSFGLFHRQRVRSLLLLDPRFNGRHDPRLSSVWRTKNLQLSISQPQVQRPIRSLGEPPGYYRQAQWLRPWRTAVVVARRNSRPIRHQAPLVVFTHSFSELLQLCICMLQSHVLASPFVGVPHFVYVL